MIITYIQSIFIKKITYIYNQWKKCFCEVVNILSLKENIFIFNQINLYLKFWVCHIKNRSLFNQKNVFNEIFYSMIFGSQIWSFVWWWNNVNLLHGLYSDFDARVSLANKLHLSALLFRFVFWLRIVKCTSIGSGFVLDCIIALNKGNLSFFSYISRSWSYN